MFQTLETKDYINIPVIPNTNPPNPNIAKPLKEPSKESKMIIEPSELPDLNESINGNLRKESLKEMELKRDRENRKTSDTVSLKIPYVIYKFNFI